MDVVEAEDAEFVDQNRAPFVSVELEYRPSAEVEDANTPASRRLRH
jgi:hypothetical protein